MENDIPNSIDLAFEWLKNVLSDQEKNAEIYNSRMVVFFSAATVILGIGFPLGFKEMTNLFSLSWTIATWLVIVSMVCYGLSVIAITIGFWPRSFVKLDNPITMREEFWDLSPYEFKTQMLSHTEDAFEKNLKALKWKSWALIAQTLLLPVETICLIFAFFIGFE